MIFTRYRHAIRWPLYRLPRPVRIAVDWLATLGIAAVLVLLLESEVAKPYRVPSSSMEPTLHCAAPAPGRTASAHHRAADRSASGLPRSGSAPFAAECYRIPGSTGARPPCPWSTHLSTSAPDRGNSCASSPASR